MSKICQCIMPKPDPDPKKNACMVCGNVPTRRPIGGKPKDKK